MKIDTHQHFWHFNAPEFPWISEAMPALRRDCLPGDRAQAMREAVMTAAHVVGSGDAGGGSEGPNLKQKE